MTRALYILPLVALLFSCSPNFYCKKCSDKGGIKADTLTAKLKVESPGVKADSVIDQTFGTAKIGTKAIDLDSLFNAQPDLFDKFRDTVKIDTGSVRVRIVPGKKIYVEVKSDPIIKYVDVPYQVTTEIHTGISKTRHVATLVIVAILALFVGAILGKLLR